MKTTRRLFALLMVVCLLAGYAVMPVYAAAATYTFSKYEAGEQYAMDEVHVLDENITVTVSDGHFTKQLRLYDSTGENGHNAIAIIKSAKAIESIVLNAGNKDATLEVYGSADGEAWALISSLTTTTAYADHTVAVPNGYTYLKLDAVGAQIRVASMSLTYVGDSGDSGETATVMGTVMADKLNVRTEPTSTSSVVAQLAVNTRVEILEQKSIDGVAWGRIAEGWINLNYVTLDGTESDEPETPTVTTVAVADGTYVISTGAYTLAALAEDKTYGYAPSGDASAPSDTDVMTITNVDGGFTMQDCYGRYLYMSGTYNNFNVGTEIPTEGHVWQLQSNGTEQYIVNVLKEKTLAYSSGYGTWGIYPTLKDTDLFALTVTAYAASEEPVAGESAENPLYPEWVWNDEYTEGTAAVTVPAGATYYVAITVSGMEMTVNGENAVVVNGSRWQAEIHPITNDGTEAAAYTLALAYPEGTQMNPEQLYMLGTQYTSLEENDFDGYYYTYTVGTDGKLLVSLTNVTEGVEADVIVTNQNSVQKTLAADGDKEGVLTLDVASGDVLTVQVVALPDASWNYPAATIFWDINYPAGTELNPLMVEFTMNDEWTEGTATVTVPANSTLYCGCWNSGMILTINGGNEQLLTAMGMGRVPAYFNVVNDTDAEAEYVLNVKYPEGTQMNPEQLYMLGTQYTALEAGDYDGYYYTCYAINDGKLLVSLTNVTEGVEADVIITNQNSIQKTLAADGDKEGVLTVEVAKGDKLTIQVVALPDANWEYPEATIFWDINYPAGTEMNPLMVDFTMNDEWTEGTATVTVPANSTLYCGCWNIGMILTINGGNEQMLTAMGMGRVPAYFNVVNDTDAEAEYVLNVKYPEGTQMNPEVSKKLGTLEVSLKAGNYDGYYYTFTAIADGVVEFSIDSITEGVEADVIVTNQNSVQKTLGADGNKEGVLTVEVAKGDVLTIQVVVLPDATWNYPAADIAVNAKLTYDVLFGDVNGDGEVGISDLMRLANHFAKGVEINEANADCNGDGTVTISDLMRLANYFAGKDVQLGK